MMTPRNNRTLRALALALAVVGWATRDAQAGSIPYGTTGWVDTPTGGAANLISFNGAGGTVDVPGSINLGTFSVAPAALSGPTLNYAGDPFHLIVYSGADQSVKIDGVLGGTIGAGTNTPLTATIKAVNTLGTGQFPFSVNLPLGTPVQLQMTNGSTTSSTILTAAAATIPEPASVAVFAAAMGGLVLWRRRAGR